jgi:ACR3 family arsenite transporter
MVLIWNDLACGSREGAVFLVAVNSVFQIVAYSLLGYFYLELLPSWLGFEQESIVVRQPLPVPIGLTGGLPGRPNCWWR